MMLFLAKVVAANVVADSAEGERREVALVARVAEGLRFARVVRVDVNLFRFAKGRYKNDY